MIRTVPELRVIQVRKPPFGDTVQVVDPHARIRGRSRYMILHRLTKVATGVEDTFEEQRFCFEAREDVDGVERAIVVDGRTA